jgi:hypothetical protein
MLHEGQTRGILCDRAQASADRSLGSRRLNDVIMRLASLMSSVMAWRTAAAISVIVSCEKVESAGSGVSGAMRRSASDNRPDRWAPSSSSSFLGCLPDVAHDRNHVRTISSTVACALFIAAIAAR